MDPDACLSMILQNIADEEWDEAVTNAKALCAWITRGGFPPGGGKLRVESLAAFLAWVINRPSTDDQSSDDATST